MRRRDLLPELKRPIDRGRSAVEATYRILLEAVEAVKAEDPSLFAPGFEDVGNVWRLNEPAT